MDQELIDNPKSKSRPNKHQGVSRLSVDKDILMQKLVEEFSYDPTNGIISRKKAKGRKPPESGRMCRYISFNGGRITTAQVAWCLSYGCPVPPRVYFLDNNPTNLKLENLHYQQPKKSRRKKSNNA
jgi:hypothetical protein